MKYILVLLTCAVVYLSGYNQGSNIGYQLAIKYAPECKK